MTDTKMPNRETFTKKPGALSACRDGDDLAFVGGAAEQRGNVVRHLGEGLAAQLPRLVEVIAPLQSGALMADGQFADVVRDAEARRRAAAMSPMPSSPGSFLTFQ